MYYDQIMASCNNLDSIIDQCEKRIASLPVGEISCGHNGKYVSWFVTENGKQRYLRKKDRDLAKKLAEAKYCSTLVKDLKKEREEFGKLLEKYAALKNEAENFLKPDSPYYELLGNEKLLFDVHQWQNVDYERNAYHPEQLIFTTQSGIRVRSKSEVLIESALSMNHIPYHYEEVLHIGDRIYIPDFTILHPRTQEIYYWEHFGIMDDPEYSKSAFSKMKDYNENGITPSINLIITCETHNNPLTTDKINKTIEEYFL